MNKLIVDKDNFIELKDNVIKLIIQVKKLTINISGKVLINEIDVKENEELNLTINMLPNSSLIYNRFVIHKMMNDNIEINQDSKSNVIFNYSLIAKDKCNLNISSTLSGNDNNTEIKVKAVSEEKGLIVIKSTAEAKSLINNNDLLESIKILTLNDEENVIIPNLLVSSNEVSINHAATISSVDKDYLFYLNSKGICKENAIELIKNGYLLSNLDINEEIKGNIKEIMGGE